jgi:hypothetical protein
MTVSLPALPDALVAFLSGGQCVVLATVDPAGNPFTTIITWVLARDNRTIVFAIDRRGRAIQNIRANGKVALELLGDGLNYGCRGAARIRKEEMTTPPFPSVLVEMTVEEVRDHASPGVLFKGPGYLFTKGKEHRQAVERTIFAELREG